MLEYLEDIIGTAKYVPLIESKEVEVDRLNDSRGEVLNRVKVFYFIVVMTQIVEKERSTLEAGKKEADFYLRKERELAREKSLLFQLYLYETSSETSALTEERNSSVSQLQSLQSESTQISSNLSSLESTVSSAHAAQEAIEGELRRCKSAYDAFERKDIQYHENLKAQKTAVKRLRARLAETAEKKAKKEGEVAELAGKLARLETEVGVSLEEKEGKERELAGMLERFQSEIDQLNEKKRELEVGIFPAFFRSKVCGRCVRSFPAKMFPSKRNARNWTWRSRARKSWKMSWRKSTLFWISRNPRYFVHWREKRSTPKNGSISNRRRWRSPKSSLFFLPPTVEFPPFRACCAGNGAFPRRPENGANSARDAIAGTFPAIFFPPSCRISAGISTLRDAGFWRRYYVRRSQVA